MCARGYFREVERRDRGKNVKCLCCRLVIDQALVDELELKLAQDERLVKEVRGRFREESCERQACQTDIASMTKAIQERAALQQEMLMTRYRQHDTLQKSNAINSERLSQVRLLVNMVDVTRMTSQSLMGVGLIKLREEVILPFQ